MKKTMLLCSLLVFIAIQFSFHQKQQPAAAPAPSFKHHFIDLSLPMNEQGTGDYGLTALVDIDKDGKLDFVLGGRTPAPSRLYWYQYQSADHWIRHDVGNNYLSDVGLAALDVDGDGWTDLVCSGVWYRNTGKPREEPFERIPFDSTTTGAHDLQIADIDGDGRKDIVMMGDSHTGLNGIYWYTIPADPHQPWTKHFVAPGIHGAISPGGVADVNGDGFADIIRADAWFENKSKGSEWIAHKNIDMGREGPFGFCVRAAVADMDGRSKKSIVMCDADIVNSKMVVLQNPGGKGESWTKKELPQSFAYGSLHALGVADFNGDGFKDIVSVEQEELLPPGRQNPRWILWTNNGNGSYTENIILDKQLGGHELQVGDVDGDGDIDICSKVWGAAKWNGAGGAIHVDFLENRSK